MPSDSVEEFLDLAAGCALLPPDLLAALRRPDAPTDTLAALTDHLRATGTLTRFQADALTTGRARELTVGRYAVTDDLGDRPFGRAFAARSSDGPPVEVWRLNPGRGVSATDIDHPHLARPLDSGTDDDGRPFAVFEPAAGESLAALVRDIGPMPSGLATAFARQAADALAAAHARGLVHGDVRLAAMAVGPLVESSRTRPDGTPLRRPADGAILKLYALGFAPGDPAADHAALGDALFEMLAGRPPLPGEPIAEARNADLPPDLAALTDDLRAGRPATFAAPPAGWVATPYEGPSASGETKFTLPDGPAAAPAPKEWTPGDRRTLRGWLLVGAGLWGLALLLWYVFFAQAGCSGTPPADDKPAKKKRP